MGHPRPTPGIPDREPRQPPAFFSIAFAGDEAAALGMAMRDQIRVGGRGHFLSEYGGDVVPCRGEYRCASAAEILVELEPHAVRLSGIST